MAIESSAAAPYGTLGACSGSSSFEVAIKLFNIEPSKSPLNGSRDDSTSINNTVKPELLKRHVARPINLNIKLAPCIHARFQGSKHQAISMDGVVAASTAVQRLCTRSLDGEPL